MKKNVLFIDWSGLAVNVVLRSPACREGINFSHLATASSRALEMAHEDGVLNDYTYSVLPDYLHNQAQC